jgi:hypothetical protein
MRFQHEGMSLWYGTSDAPAPNELVTPGTEVIVTVGVEPADASNRIEVSYRLNGGSTQTAPTRWLRGSSSGEAQYFEAHLGPFRDGDRVEYSAICKCAGRQVPSAEEAAKFASSFQVTADAKLGKAVSETLRGETTKVSCGGNGVSWADATVISPMTLAMGKSTENQDRKPLLINPGLRKHTIADRNLSPVVSKSSSENPKLLKQYVIAGTIITPEGVERFGVNVQAFDRDLPSLERRAGSAPQILGEAITDSDGRFEITYLLEQFRTREGTSLYSRVREKHANVSFRVFDKVGQELNIKNIKAPDCENLSDQMIFNSPASLDVSIFVDAPEESVTSEYERLIALIEPVVGDLPLTELSDEDVVFLINEFGVEQQSEIQQHIEWLRRSALLAQQTNLAAEAFYGWGRQHVPDALKDLAAKPLTDLAAVLEKISGLSEERLRDALLAAVKQNIIPVRYGDRVDDIVRLLKRRDQVLHKVIVKLLDEDTRAVLSGYTVTTFDQDSGGENRGLNETDNDGKFSFGFYTSKGMPANALLREFRLEVGSPDGEKLSEDGHVSVNINKPETEVFPAFIKTSKTEINKKQAQFKRMLFDVPSELRTFLSEKQTIQTLADIRRKGGLSHLADLPAATDSSLIRTLDSLADLDRISSDISVNKSLMSRDFDSVLAIADTPRTEFVSKMGNGEGALSEPEASSLHVMARTQTDLLGNLLLSMAVDKANGFNQQNGDADKDDAANDAVVEQKCGCSDCEAAVSPAAYLTALLDYSLKHIRNNENKIDLQFLADTFHQPFIDLPIDCEAVENQLHQTRICIEVLRSFLGTRPLANPEKEAALAKAESDYSFAVYALLLSGIGTSYEEIRRIRSETDENRKALADRLGIDLTEPRLADELDQLFLDPGAQPPQDHLLTEHEVERLFGLADTRRDPLSEGAKLGDDKGQITRWNLNGAIWGQNTDAEGMVHFTLAHPEPAIFRVELHQDFLRTKLIASGEIATANGRVKLVQESNSRLYGIIEIAYTEDSSVISIAAIPNVLSWRLKHLRTLWFQQDHPSDGYSEDASPRLPIIDPDLIGPDDFRNPTPKTNPADPDRAFDIWLKRRQFVDSKLSGLKGDREAKGIAEILKQVFGDPLPDLDGLLLTLTKSGTTADEITVSKDSIAALNLSLESFARLMTIRAKDQLAPVDIRNEQVSEQEWREVYSILAHALKTREFDAWRVAEQTALVKMGLEEFWFSVTEPKEGDWPPVPIAGQPLIDPGVMKLTDLPDWLAGMEAINLWNIRKARIEQIPKDLKTERESKGFEAMLSLALGHPNPGQPLQHDVDKLNANLGSADDDVRSIATKAIETDLYQTVENFRRLMGIKAANDQPEAAKKPTAAEFAEVYAILAPARKLKHEYPAWLLKENSAGLVYSKALKARLPIWRASTERRQTWQQALRVRSQPPIIDPTLMGADDLQHVIPGDPAFDLWKKRFDLITVLHDEFRTAREAAEPDTLAGFDQDIKDALGFESADLEALDLERQAGHSIEKRLDQLNLINSSFNYLLRIRGLAKANQPIVESEWETVYDTLTRAKTQRLSAEMRSEEQNQHISLSPDLFKIPEELLTPLPFLDLSTPRWLSTWQARRDWQDMLQSRIDQETSIIESLASAISAVEEATLPALRDALIQASGAISANLTEQAEWITAQLLIDAGAGGCLMTTRVAQALETLQLLLFRLRSGQIRQTQEWVPAQNWENIRTGSAPASVSFIEGDSIDAAFAVVGEDNRIYSALDSRISDGPWVFDSNHTVPTGSELSLFVLQEQRRSSLGGQICLFAIGNTGFIEFALWSGSQSLPWAAVGNIQVRANAKVTVAAAESEGLLYAFAVQDDGVIVGTWRDTQWHEWVPIGGNTFRVPKDAKLAAASLDHGVDLFVAGNDGKIYRHDAYDNWTPINAAGSATFLPGASISVRGLGGGDDFIELVAVAKDGEIYRTSWDSMSDSWAAWSREGTLAVSSDAIVTMAGEFGSTRLFTVGKDGRVYEKGKLDWEPIGDTTFTVRVVAVHIDSAGATHLYLAKKNQVLTTFQPAPGAPWHLFASLALEAPWFDEEWKWIGSYATWRAAMFVFLYPENILQPSLVKDKTPVFGNLIKKTRTARINPNTACLEAETYANYFSDICSLEIEATCQASTIGYTGEGCDRRPYKAQSMFYMFGRAVSGKIYWSAYDPGGNSSGYGQKFWKEVEGFEGEKVGRIVGAMPYREVVSLNNSGASTPAGGSIQSSYIYLFCLVDEGSKQTLKLKRLNLDDFGSWDKTEIDLMTPELPSSISTLEVIPVQTQSEFVQPGLILHKTGDHRLYYRQLAANGLEWEQKVIPWSKFYFVTGFKVVGNIEAALRVKGVNLWLVNRVYPGQSTFELRWTDLVPENVPGSNTSVFVPFDDHTVNFLGALPGPEGTSIIDLGLPSTVYVFLRTSSGAYYRRFTSLLDDAPVHDAWADLVRIPEHSGSGAVAQEMFAYQREQNSKAYYMYKYAGHGHELIGSASFRTGPRVSARLNIPLHLSETNLQLRRQAIVEDFALNSDATASVLTYLREAYYFVPLHLALALQSAGHHLASLDCFRTIYDYESQVGPPNQRNIYYGLELDAKLPDVPLYQQADGWLLDPLNPHAIAATRHLTYTRFTIMSLVRCLLDFADSEFTQETGESIARARTLYLTALDLLNLPELQQRLGKCDDLIAELKIEPGKDIPPEVPAAVGEILEDFTKTVSHLPSVVAALKEVNSKLSGKADWNVKLTEARSVIQTAVAAAPLSHRTGSMVLSKSRILKEQYALLLAQPLIDDTLQHVGKTVARNIFDGVGIVGPAVQPEISKAPQALSQVGLLAVISPSLEFCIPPNPILKALRLHAELNLFKLRTCRNIAGLKRQLDPYAAPTDTTSGLPAIGAGGQLVLPGIATLQPSLYRYPVLIERAKQLVQLAAQIEASLLSTLERRDAEAQSLLLARQQVGLAQAGVRLQDLRVGEANDGVTLADLQNEKAQIQIDTYQDWLETGANEYEEEMIFAYRRGAQAQISAADASTSIQIKQSAIFSAQLAAQAAAAGPAGFGLGLSSFIVDVVLFDALRDQQRRAINFGLDAQIASINAALERRKDEWRLQKRLAEQDSQIGEQQKKIANDHVQIATQERAIAGIQADNAQDSVEFLTNKFSNVELFDWMSNILEGVYSFFLQQATAMAKLGENQLAFERQEVPPAYINADYWDVSSETGELGSSDGQSTDRHGLTGSARLLQDIYQLDQYAFATNKRKLTLTKTISLSRLAPVEFQRFRETGVMPFATPMELFDRGFPGHYLRLIKQVRTSVIALIPPIDGIHATLSTTGPSRVVIGGDVFQTVPIKRPPEFIAMSAPNNSTGMFELNSQPDLLLPFEGSGVEMSWEFNMPKAANPFDYSTIADVLITLEYTALYSFDYRQQVIQSLRPTISADRPFSLRSQFADQWYDLHNPEQTSAPMTVRFTTVREDFPSNVESLKIQHVLLYFVRTDAASFEVPVSQLRYTAQGEPGNVGGSATSIDGIISTRRGNAGSWTAMIGKSPIGEWELSLPNTEEIRNRFGDDDSNETIADILLVLTYSGRTPEWPN